MIKIIILIGILKQIYSTLDPKRVLLVDYHGDNFLFRTNGVSKDDKFEFELFFTLNAMSIHCFV